MKSIACAAAVLLFAALPAGAQEAAPVIAEPSAAEVAAASVIPERFMARLMDGNATGAIGGGFAGTMMEYETAGLQSVIDAFEAMTDYYGPVTGYELGSQQVFTSRLMRQTYLAMTDNGPFVVGFELYRRPTGWMLLRINVNDSTQNLFGAPLGAVRTVGAAAAD